MLLFFSTLLIRFLLFMNLSMVPYFYGSMVAWYHITMVAWYHTLLGEILKDKNANLSYLQSLVNFQFWTFARYHLNICIWIQFVQTLGTSCIYTTYLDNCIVYICLFFTLGTYTYTSKLYSVFIAFQWFTSVFFSSVIYFSLCLH